ncbi:hypothetical protein QVD17_08018 [Tagetes erecta]|uniref:Uncharacterized protein n=1 Tax=Tagetes erecta TaxID=13708 RepID=A0AAD8L1Y7_TARER|nr:hypothetical protein QVD17_08018 [Tagetes erecta]
MTTLAGGRVWNRSLPEKNCRFQAGEPAQTLRKPVKKTESELEPVHVGTGLEVKRKIDFCTSSLFEVFYGFVSRLDGNWRQFVSIWARWIKEKSLLLL